MQEKVENVEFLQIFENDFLKNIGVLPQCASVGNTPPFFGGPALRLLNIETTSPPVIDRRHYYNEIHKAKVGSLVLPHFTPFFLPPNPWVPGPQIIMVN